MRLIYVTKNTNVVENVVDATFIRQLKDTIGKEEKRKGGGALN